MRNKTVRVQNQNEGSVKVCGKFLYVDHEKFYIKGVTYGTFAPDEQGHQFPDSQTITRDFEAMAEQGFNTVRTYTVPPLQLLDTAHHFGLRVMVGLPWAQHISFLDDPDVCAGIIKSIQDAVLSCKGHPALLCYTIGNEIPAPIVRWHGKEAIENFLHRIYKTVKRTDPTALATYVNFPTTEYLDLSFTDFYSFNVYLESPGKMSSYLARLQNLCADKPLVLAEIGLDSRRNGEAMQAEVLEWQVQTIYGGGCAGMFVFSWTDSWWRGGFEIEDWDFGLVTRDRQPKLALPVVTEALHNVPYNTAGAPFISVVVCTYNGSATIKDCMEGLQNLAYKNYEVIVVNDGSTDGVANIVAAYPVQLITTTNHGLSSARNTGARAARGEIVAFIDDDAYPDPHWLQYLAYAYETTDHAGFGGPNLAPDEDKALAHCVANAPGGPVHVLTTDEVAEHVPGCNMSFRRHVYLEVGGCDPLYRVAGDDVDLCWRVQKAGYTIGYHPAALVWHHRRASLKAYWKQQMGYGKAEALLERKWPEKYNGFGHLAWAGRIYGNGLTEAVPWQKKKVFYGTWGTALFQSVYQPAQGFIAALPLMPEWYLVVAMLSIFSLMSIFLSGFIWAVPMLVLSVGVVVAQCLYSAYARSTMPIRFRKKRYLLLIALLHLLQPAARLYGRLKHGLTPWRKRQGHYALFTALNHSGTGSFVWSEVWRPLEDWVTALEQNLMEQKIRVQRGTEFSRWDLQVRNGFAARTTAQMVVEEHGAGKQLLRMRLSSTPSKTWIISTGISLLLVAYLGVNEYYASMACMMVVGSLFLFEFFRDTSFAQARFHQAFIAVGEADNNTLAPEEQIKQPIQVITHVITQPIAAHQQPLEASLSQ